MKYDLIARNEPIFFTPPSGKTSGPRRLFKGGGSSGTPYYAEMDRLYGVQSRAAEFMLDQSMPYLPNYMGNSGQMTREAMDGTLARQMQQQAGNEASASLGAALDANQRNMQRYGAQFSADRLLSEGNRNAIMGAASKAGAINQATAAAEDMKWNRNAGALAQASGMGSGAMESVGGVARGYGAAGGNMMANDAVNARGYGQFGAAVAKSMFRDGGEVRPALHMAAGGDAWSAWKNNNPIQSSSGKKSGGGSALGAMVQGAAPIVALEGAKSVIGQSGLGDAVRSGVKSIGQSLGLGSAPGGAGISGSLGSAGTTAGAMEAAGGLGSGISGGLATGELGSAAGIAMPQAAAGGMEALGGLGSGIAKAGAAAGAEAIKINEETGERTEFAKSARAGRVVAAIYEFKSALKNAAINQQTALFEISGRTVSTCTMCGGGTTASADDHQTLTCESCGAILDRKKNGAANAWAATSEGIEDRVREYWSETIAEAQRRDEAKQATLLRMQEGRRKARTASNDENQAGSRTDKVA